MVTKRSISRYNMKPAEAARKIELTPAAISHYVKDSRGRATVDAILSSRKVQKVASDLEDEFLKNSIDMTVVLSKLCQACRAVRLECLLCNLHGELVPSLETSSCKICK